MQPAVKNELLRRSFLSLEKDILVQKILLTHDPDGRHIDSQMLLQGMENVMFHTTMSTVSESHLAAMAGDNICDVEVVGADEVLGHTIHLISQQIQCKCSGDGDSHGKTMTLLDLLRNFTWDAKIVIVLAAFATSYGQFWLVIQLHAHNPLAVLVALLKQLPNNLSAFKPRFKALTLLVKSMVDVSKCILEFESLIVQNIKLDDKPMVTTKSEIYIAVYWVIRSTLTCSSIITELTASNHEKVNLSSITIATWELSSLGCKMSGLCGYLQKQVDMCNMQIEDKLRGKLSYLFKESHMDNQQVLCTLISLKDDMPLKGCSSSAKLGVSELLNKVVVLLISKPDILPLEDLLFLVQQTRSLPQDDELQKTYEIVWVPISSSNTWSNTEVEVFNLLSNTLPWYSIRHPWLLSSVVVKYVKQVWNFVDEPLMVVLDPRGRVSSTDAISMVFIWGSVAYPFATWREEQLWQDANWSLKVVIDGVDPLMAMRVEEGRTICLYGSDDLQWIREFTHKIREITRAGVQLELVYVGKSKPDATVSNIISAIAREKLSGYLSLQDIHFFWLRLESIQRSKLQLGKSTDTDRILKEVVSLTSRDDSKNGWALLGQGSSPDTVQSHGSDLIKCLSLFPVWVRNIEKLGFLGALRTTLDHGCPPFPKCCYRSNIVPYFEGWTEGTVVCEECKRSMEKLILYQCQGTQ